MTDMKTFESLCKRYDAYSELNFRQLDQGLILVDVCNEWAYTSLSLYGGQLLRYQSRSNGCIRLYGRPGIGCGAGEGAG
jgi:hypothetical protein